MAHVNRSLGEMDLAEVGAPKLQGQAASVPTVTWLRTSVFSHASLLRSLEK